ncbi:HAD family hydrolase [Aureispira anguillae]|uniref:phosphoglycolate phosphatase n=1 Tax=Aureispira anguillae TaxID=2864201 RepID=A0A915YHK1_9BACT|nr:HAD family hydrolase [Aureispira anguillae]BDS13185.1 HAD family hydrolase [Aureispira anguillae]
MSSKKNLVVFDIDGTLTDSVAVHQHCFRVALQQFGVADVTMNFGTFKHHTDSFIAKEIIEHSTTTVFNTSEVAQFETFLMEELLKAESIPEIKGAKQIIEFLENETNYAICYATGSLRRPAAYKLECIGIEFQDWQLVASNQLYEREEIVAKAILNAQKQYGLSQFDTVISIGDGLWDLKTARNLGLEFIGMGTANKKRLEQNGSSINLDDFTQFNLPSIEKEFRFFDQSCDKH